MSEPVFESDDDVEAALSAAVQEDQATEDAQQAEHDAKTSAPSVGENDDVEVQPEAEAETPSFEDTFDDGKFNPDDLPPELQPAWRQLQAAFTRKTQGVAERTRELEALGDVESVKQAVQLAQAMSNPANWPAIYDNLSATMEQYGMFPGYEGELEREPDFEDLDDPDLAPFRNELTALQTELSQLRNERQFERQQEELGRTHMAIVGELTRQENAILSANPKYQDSDLDRIYELASFHNGNLFAAQEAYEAIRASSVEQYLASKEDSTRRTSGQSAPKAAVTSTLDSNPEQTLAQAALEAEEELRALIQSGEVEF